MSSFEKVENSKQTITSLVGFEVKNTGIMVRGVFQGFKGVVNFNPDDLASSEFDASVDTRTIDTGNAVRNNYLKKEEYFSVEAYPKISMKARGVEKISEGNYKATFDFTLKGTTKIVSCPFSYSKTSTGYKLNGFFNINRRDYNVGGSSWLLSEDVKIFLDLEVKN
jgi:polyisoprenoid-binding protein YceI